ncbi:dephospho-CoA kinase [Spiroplasma culicicola]|uniref:Dephospho-CoA kinase n=1 Tax=Spiroplasma culicicola AES-1 TaxID=1276246 RepID=W6A7S1_9MOLU|nr:dephospho-CoA kinase [Spiroplasma culicicola]AHI52920.1 dephospho-CoA kinase [Spiroplasma culicicola AES-1]
MKLIGVSGFIGSGKTTLLNYIKSNPSVKVIEADEVSKEVINLPQVIDFLKKYIPQSIEEGKINRQILRESVFCNNKLNDQFTSIVWPLISKRILEIIQSIKEEYQAIVVEAAMINGLDIKFDTTILLKKEEEKRMDSVMIRDKRNINEIQSISEYQFNKLKDYHFDYILENNNDIDVFYQNIDDLFKKIL